MGKIIASCLHEVEEVGDLVAVEYDDVSIDYDSGCLIPAVITDSYCPKCASEGIEEGLLRKTVSPS